MIRTPEEFRRNDVKKLFDKILKTKKIELEPLDIVVKESLDSDFTMVDLAIKEVCDGLESTVKISECEAKGFVDGIFKACYKQYKDQHDSLKNIKLIDYQIAPRFSKSKNTMGSEAETAVTLMVKVKDHGIAEFNCVSRSILYSSFVATLDSYQFYMNCDRTFEKMKIIIEDAQARNRGDIAQQCMSDLALLTGVNTYEK